MEAIEKSSKHETKIYRDARDIALPITAPRKKYYPKQGASSIVNLSGTSMYEGQCF